MNLRALTVLNFATHLIIIICKDTDAMDEFPESQLGTKNIYSRRLPFFADVLDFLATSRPTENIQAVLDIEPLRSLTTKLDLDGDNSDSDIKLFLQSKFQEIKQSHPARYALPIPWLSKEGIDVLVERSIGQFHYVTTMMEFVGSLHSPSYRLDIVLSPLVGAETPSSPLEALQLQISLPIKSIQNLLPL